MPAPGASPELLALVVDELACGVVVTSLTGVVLYANQAAHLEMERTGVLSIRGNLLQAHSLEDGKTLQDALSRAAEGKRSLINLPGDASVRLSLAAVPLKAEAGLAARVALFFSRAAVYESLTLCFFARNHGLTATEEQVLAVLCQGYSTPEIAQQMRVAVSTIRSHVRSLCAKTRSSGVRELVNRVAVLPPAASALQRGPMH
nr:PAS and helix-turn-helix domain-containing protein [Variovorax terrae]